MASLAECTAVLAGLSDRLAGLDPALRERYLAERTVACRITDLDVVFTGRLTSSGLQDVAAAAPPGERAQLRLAVSSDDLVALAAGRLAVSTAWTTGRLRVSAAPLDLLRLRGLL